MSHLSKGCFHLAVLSLLLPLPSVCAQSSSSAGQVQGVLVDSTGAPMPGVSVTIFSTSTGVARSSATGESGQFLFSALPIGEYRLRVESTGFARVETAEFLVSVGQTLSKRIELKPAMVSERLEVSDQPEALQPAATSTNVALGYDRIEEAPSQGRNYLSFVFAAPGVATSNGSNTARSAAATRNASNDSGFVFNGMRGRNNSLSIDGVDNRDETTGGNRVAIGLEMVQEFRVSATAVSAEFGGAAGGVLNVVTRSGTNLWHGDFTYFFQNELLNARNPEAATTARPRSRRSQPGVSSSGPIRKDRTFFAAALEGAWESAAEWSEPSTELAGLLERALASPAFARSGVRKLTAGLFPTNSQDTESSFKLNHTLNSKHALTARYAFSRGRVEEDVQGVDNFTDWSARGSSQITDHSLVGSLVSVLSPTKVNDLRAQFSQRSSAITPNAPGPMFDIPGVLTLSGAYRLDQGRTEDHFEIVDSLSVATGAHLLSLGGSIHTVGLDARLANRFQGIYVFPTLGDFMTGRPDVYFQAFGISSTSLRTTPAGLWFQDRWQPKPGLTFDIGMRFDYQWLPSGLVASRANVAPRIGVAWRPKPTSPWVLRGAAGLFYDRYPLAYLNEAIQKDGRHGFEQYATGEMAERIFRLAQGGPLPAPDKGTIASAYQASSVFPSTYSRKIAGGIERLLDSNTTVSLEVSSVRGLRLPRIRNFTGTVPPQYLLEQTARSNYLGGTVTLNRRMSKELSYLVAYSAGLTRDDASDFDEQPMYPLDLTGEWALSRQHQLQRVTASALFEIPVDEWQRAPASVRKALDRINLAPSFSHGSGRPLNALSTTDSLRTGAYPISARPFGLGRNPFYGPATTSFDLRLFKVLSVHEGRAYWVIGVEAFNLMNHTNPLRVSPYYAAGAERLASYRRPLEIQNARQIQLLLAFEY